MVSLQLAVSPVPTYDTCSPWDAVPVFNFTPAINHLWACIMSLRPNDAMEANL